MTREDIKEIVFDEYKNNEEYYCDIAAAKAGYHSLSDNELEAIVDLYYYGRDGRICNLQRIIVDTMQS